MLVVIAHCSVQSRHVATGKVTDGIHRLGAVLAEDGLCRESGSSVMRLGFPRALHVPLAMFAASALGFRFARACATGVLASAASCKENARISGPAWSPLDGALAPLASVSPPHGPCSIVFQTTISCSSRLLDTSSPSAHGGSWWINLASPLKLAWSQTPHSLILRCAFARK